MDPDIRTALTDLKTDLKTDLREGFDRQSKQIDAMVTRGEFTATVERLDSSMKNLQRDLNVHESEAPAHRQAALDRAEAVRTEVRGELEGFRATTRWAIGLSATGAGILVAALTWIIDIIVR